MTDWTNDELEGIEMPLLYIAGENEKMMSLSEKILSFLNV